MVSIAKFTVTGSYGINHITTDTHADVIDADAGTDLIVAKTGSDTVATGTGANLVALSTGTGYMIVIDFTIGALDGILKFDGGFATASSTCSAVAQTATAVSHFGADGVFMIKVGSINNKGSMTVAQVEGIFISGFINICKMCSNIWPQKRLRFEVVAD